MDQLALPYEDVHSKELFLMGSFWSPFLVLNIYLIFILDVGPKFMQDRPAFNLKKLMMTYNLIQILLNIWLFIRALETVKDIDCFCGDLDKNVTQKTLDTVKLFHDYHLLKVSDLMDTVIFVLRKKNNQVSKLHIYHHVCVIIVSWLGTKYYPGGQGAYIILVNTFVHIIMYFYYFLTNIDTAYTSWWKKYITQLQIAQHLGVTLIFTISLLTPSCTYPNICSYVVIPNGITMFVLFTNFYRKHYTTKKIK